MPSELVNSVISRPQPPSPRITRRNSVSVTPAIGARTVAGRIHTCLTRYSAGIAAEFAHSAARSCAARMLRARAVKLGLSQLMLLTLLRRWRVFQVFIQAQKLSAERSTIHRPVLFPGSDRQGRAHRGHLRIQVIEIVKNESLANHG